jgi:hypothetical protein
MLKTVIPAKGLNYIEIINTAYLTLYLFRINIEPTLALTLSLGY